jgi:thioredoxin-related protein
MNNPSTFLRNRWERPVLAAALLIIFVWAIAFTSFATSSEQGKSSAIEWQEFSKALELAKQQNKMVVVDFYTDWCGWCKRMDKDTYGHADVVKYAKAKLIMSKVDAESQDKTRFKDRELTYQQLALGMGVRGYPTTAFFDSNGDLITSISSYLTAEQFMPILEYLSEGHYKTMKFEAFMAKRKS